MHRYAPLFAIVVSGCTHSADEAAAGAVGSVATTELPDETTLPTTSGPGGDTTDAPATGTSSESGGSSDSSDSDASTGAEAVCGDGIVEGEESCDDGFLENLPGNHCTDECQWATCGDGHVQASNLEACDDGALNVEAPGYGQCSTNCVRGAFCGDGIVQTEAGEECEPAGRDDEVKNCAGMCRHKPRLLFVTSSRHTGDIGGLAGADQICNKFAAQQDLLTGSYRAWLLVDGQSLADRFPEFTAPVAWNFTNTAAGLLAKDFAELVKSGPKQPIAFTEAGEPRPKEYVWTGITADGLAAGGDCGQWTSTAGAPALVGFTGHVPSVGPEALKWQLERQWTDKASKRPCSQKYAFYCIQVGD